MKNIPWIPALLAFASFALMATYAVAQIAGEPHHRHGEALATVDAAP